MSLNASFSLPGLGVHGPHHHHLIGHVCASLPQLGPYSCDGPAHSPGVLCALGQEILTAAAFGDPWRHFKLDWNERVRSPQDLWSQKTAVRFPAYCRITMTWSTQIRIMSCFLVASGLVKSKSTSQKSLRIHFTSGVIQFLVPPRSDMNERLSAKIKPG